MAKVVDSRNLPDVAVSIAGLKGPVRDFSPTDNGYPSEVDAFNQLVRELRNQSPATHPDVR